MQWHSVIRIDGAQLCSQILFKSEQKETFTVERDGILE